MSDRFASTLRFGSLCTALLGAALLTGCGPADATGGMSSSSSSSSGGGVVPGGAGKTEFLTKVFPLMTACQACHVNGEGGAPKFLGADGESSYAAISAFTKIFQSSATSSLPSKPDHAGKALDATGKAVATAWLDIEFPKAGAGGGTPPPVTGATGFNAAVAEFSKCMRQGDWIELMSTFPFIQTDGGGACAGCHASGNGGTFLNADKDITFKNIKQVPFVYRLVTPIYDGDKIVELKASDRLLTKGQSTTNCFDPQNIYCHFSFQVPQNESTNLSTFQQRTLLRMKNLVCVEP